MSTALEINKRLHFQKTITLRKALLLMMSNMIGVGIFIYPSLISNKLPHPLWFILVWILGGLISIAGAMTLAELAIYYPEAGGDYAFIKHEYGLRWAFLEGFVCFFLSYPGGLALGLSLVVHYQGATIFGSWVNDIIITNNYFSLRYYQLLAAGFMVFLTLFNHFGLKFSFMIQRVATLLPVVVMIGLALTVFALHGASDGSSSLVILNFSGTFSYPDFSSLGTAMVAVYWSFTGWNSTLTMAEEIKNPEKTIPRAMIFGPIFVMTLYCLFAFVFLSVIPYKVLQNENDPFYVVGSFLSQRIFNGANPYLPVFLSAIIFMVVIGNLNSNLISGTRIYVAMARDGIFWRRAGILNPKTNVPTVSLWAQCGITVLYILAMEKETKLMDFAFLEIILLSTLTAFGLFLIKLRNPENPANIKLGYPFALIFYVVFALWIFWEVVKSYFIKGDFQILIFVAIHLIFGIVLYEIWKKRHKSLAELL